MPESDAGQLYLTSHAMARRSQRGVKLETIELIMEQGEPSVMRGGALGYALNKRTLAELERYHKREIQKLEKAKGKVVIVSGDKVLTTYHEQRGTRR